MAWVQNKCIYSLKRSSFGGCSAWMKYRTSYWLIQRFTMQFTFGAWEHYGIWSLAKVSQLLPIFREYEYYEMSVYIVILPFASMNYLSQLCGCIYVIIWTVMQPSYTAERFTQIFILTHKEEEHQNCLEGQKMFCYENDISFLFAAIAIYIVDGHSSVLERTM